MKHISSIASGVALGSAGLIMMSVLSGCQSEQKEEKQQQNKFLVIEQLTNGKYIVVEETPTSGPSRAIIREKGSDGNITERIMSEGEMKKLAEEEYQKVQSGSSETLKSGEGNAGMGLAGTILAVAAGSLMGNMIGNALMKNKSFASNSTASNRSAYSRSASGASSSSSSGAKKSFFGGSSGASSSGGSSSYGG
ncbi:hypothetical protein [Sulfurimonas sp.]|uniref:hypothetical protein n=1 Tax=Sulfurimonas sp. TaxID=2022749 RepID=UPI0025F9842F|nr:hypothetical protein [Sulfurimonas sp.]MDD5156650.1 hypothetical protein [Sulfurimonas sp.]